ncbi:uncharacterized protein LOC129768619 [Toxorhynchites rutilus septentrionalis]|uniref:uncharacterized protein LOC129768619 n=1 Tax=Toxorhynchites rutilus septentrionalis TaxID=329112 RepID=UPI0024795A11|nr:uncharacterized protein LOC129768619 [Toxorhynchites rutilus septentrionalis]
MGPTKMTPEDQQFNIAFVAEVKKHPCLFDSNSTEYKQAQVQDKAWQAVSGNVNESVDMCKKRWRNLRCCMTRYLKSVRDSVDNGANLRRKPYYLYNHMQFVVPYLKMKDGEGANYESEDSVWIKSSNSTDILKQDDEEEEHEIETIDVHEEDHQQIKQSIIQSIKILPMSQEQSQETTTTYEIIEATPSKQPRIESVHQVAVGTPTTSSQQLIKQKDQSGIKHYTYTTVSAPQSNTTPLYSSTPAAPVQHQQQVATSSSNIQRQQTTQPQQISLNAANDADSNFFKSLIPDIQSMNMDQKRKLKIGILRLIDEILSTT